MKKQYQDRYKQSDSFFQNKHARYLGRRGKVYNRFKSPLTDTVGNSKIIHAPASISIYDADKLSKEAFINTLDFREQLKKHVGNENCLLDFSKTEHITVAAMLVIFSEVQTSINVKKNKTVIGWSRKSSAVNSMLRRTGLKKLLTTGDSIHTFSSMRDLPIVNGVGNQHYDDIVDFIIERYFNKNVNPDTEHLISDALSETINNVGRHAYPSFEQNDKPWWLMCDVIGNQLYLAIYDRGVGIPKTVVEKKWFLASLEETYPDLHGEYKEMFGDDKGILEFFTIKKYKDAELIYLSMLGDVSGTKESKHGQGSKSFKALVNDTDGGSLWVYSSKGLYKFEDEDSKPQVYKLPKDIGGTLNQWNICVT